jgi:hypothetical protein
MCMPLFQCLIVLNDLNLVLLKSLLHVRYVFSDGGRNSLHGNFVNSFKSIGGLKWKQMYLIYSEKSCSAGL